MEKNRSINKIKKGNIDQDNERILIAAIEIIATITINPNR